MTCEVICARPGCRTEPSEAALERAVGGDKPALFCSLGCAVEHIRERKAYAAVALS